MDGRRFDALTKTLSTGTSRRRVLRGIAGAFGGAALAWRAKDVDAQGCLPNGRVCPTSRPGACCTGVCDERRDPRRGVGRCRACQTDVDCPPFDPNSCIGGQCADGTCVFFVIDCGPDTVCCERNGEATCCPA
jgi:hypothetical protein